MRYPFLYLISLAVVLPTLLGSQALAETPFRYEVQKLVAGDGSAFEFFGSSVAIGQRSVIVGAVSDDQEFSGTGAAYIFALGRNGGWRERQKLLPSDGQVGGFGWGLGIDGTTAVVGARIAQGADHRTGAAYLYIRGRRGQWSERLKLFDASGQFDDQYGWSTTVDKNTLVVGVPRVGIAGRWSGAVFVYRRNKSGRWMQEQVLRGDENDDGFRPQFGLATAISGNTIVVGTDGVAAYVFSRQRSGVWVQQAKLFASDGDTGRLFGHAVAISRDTIVVGSWFPTAINPGGAAYVYRRVGQGDWSAGTKILPSDIEPQDGFGRAVAVAGGKIVVTAIGDDDNGPGSGSAYVFSRGVRGGWNERVKLLASDGVAGHGFGWSVAADNGTAVVGAVRDGDRGDLSGSAYIFRLDGQASGGRRN